MFEGCIVKKEEEKQEDEQWLLLRAKMVNDTMFNADKNHNERMKVDVNKGE